MIDFCKNFCAYLTTLEFQLGMLFAAVLILLLTLIWTLCIAVRRRCDSITVRNAAGDFVVSRRALFSFLGNVLSRFPGFVLNKLVLRKAAKGKYALRLYLKVQEAANVVEQSKIREALLSELGSKLGVADQVARMDLIVVTVKAAAPEEPVEADELEDGDVKAGEE